MKTRSKGMAYLAGVIGVVILFAGMCALSLLDSSLYRTFNMGYAGLLIRTGLYVVILAVAIWGILRWQPKVGEHKLRWVIVAFVAVVSFLMINTVRDLFTPPVTCDFETYFYYPSSRGFSKPIQIYATPLHGDGKNDVSIPPAPRVSKGCRDIHGITCRRGATRCGLHIIRIVVRG